MVSRNPFLGTRQNDGLEGSRFLLRAAGGRLSTQAAWAFAARAGTTGARYGSLDAVVWNADNSEAIVSRFSATSTG